MANKSSYIDINNKIINDEDNDEIIARDLKYIKLNIYHLLYISYNL
jgi:hypothetical protein